MCIRDRRLRPNSISRFSKLFQCHNQEKNKVLLDYFVKCHRVGAKCRSVSLITPLVSAITSLSASSISKVDTLNIWCKNCRMWQLLQTITETLNTLLPAVNFLKCVVTEVVIFSTVAFKTLDISQGSVPALLRCDEIFSDSIITNFRLILTAK